MTTEHFLTEDDKTESLLALREALVVDIEKLVAKLNIDEISFSISEYEPTTKKRESERYIPESTLYRHCQVVKSIDLKIEELKNV
jgi:hypothetical protein